MFIVEANDEDLWWLTEMQVDNKLACVEIHELGRSEAFIYLFIIIIIVEEYHLISHMVPKEYGDKKPTFSSKLNKIISFFLYIKIYTIH